MTNNIPENIKTFHHEHFAITTSIKPKKEEVLTAIELAEELGSQYISRRSFNSYIKSNPLDFYYVVEKDMMRIRWGETDSDPSGEFFFHPASSKMRMRNIRHKQRDHLIEILDLQGDEIIYDLTLGLGSEAILMSAHLKTGKIVGVEASKHIYTIVKYGMQTYVDQSKWVNESFSRIELVNSDYKKWIREQADKSCDYCYCDPMFDNPVMTSSGFNPLRPFAIYDKITPEDIVEMKRITRKKIILKALSRDSLFKKIPTDEIRGSRTSGVLYGVIEV
jgi:hypothetical protein